MHIHAQIRERTHEKCLSTGTSNSRGETGSTPAGKDVNYLSICISHLLRALLCEEQILAQTKITFFLSFEFRFPTSNFILIISRNNIVPKLMTIVYICEEKKREGKTDYRVNYFGFVLRTS